MIILFFKKHSDLGWHCLSIPFWQATTVQNLRTLIFLLYLWLPKGEEGIKMSSKQRCLFEKMIDIIMFICPYLIQVRLYKLCSSKILIFINTHKLDCYDIYWNNLDRA